MFMQTAAALIICATQRSRGEQIRAQQVTLESFGQLGILGVHHSALLVSQSLASVMVFDLEHLSQHLLAFSTDSLLYFQRLTSTLCCVICTNKH